MSGLIVNFGKRIRIRGGVHWGTEVNRTEGQGNWRTRKGRIARQMSSSFLHNCALTIFGQRVSRWSNLWFGILLRGLCIPKRKCHPVVWRNIILFSFQRHFPSVQSSQMFPQSGHRKLKSPWVKSMPLEKLVQELEQETWKSLPWEKS